MGGAHEGPTTAKELLMVDGCWKDEEASFLQGKGFEDLPTLQETVLHDAHTAAPSELSVFFLIYLSIIYMSAL